MDPAASTEVVPFPGAVAPDRQWRLTAGSFEIAVHEWGEADAPPLFLVHGGFDFARTFDVFAPVLAAAGWRVVSWDQRGHGDSDHVDLYSWDADLRDAMYVMDAVTDAPAPVVGHSKGGAMMLQLADAQSYRFSHLVNIDGIPYRTASPDVSDHERTRMMSSDVSDWLDHRRRVALASRKPDTLDGLAKRRGVMNPRLSHDWLRRLVTVGARHDADGWRWKIDPAMRIGGFGPWRPEWTVSRMPGLPMPFLGILATQPEAMGWGTRVEDIQRFLPARARCEVFDDAGHFVHIEQPHRVAAAVLDFVATS
ncbi:MAG: hypothetical protein JWM34_3132 [Ilumatobacteraceae bacterium]|nr:hypothetical protein [Ilumatobacteraceae bacterium]